jgi:hypothetical protein
MHQFWYRIMPTDYSPWDKSSPHGPWLHPFLLVKFHLGNGHEKVMYRSHQSLDKTFTISLFVRLQPMYARQWSHDKLSSARVMTDVIDEMTALLSWYFGSVLIQDLSLPNNNMLYSLLGYHAYHNKRCISHASSKPHAASYILPPGQLYPLGLPMTGA